MLVAVSYHLKGLATLVDDTAVWDPGNDERNEERYDLFRYDVRLHGFLVPECICAILFRTTTGHDVSPEELRTIQENVHRPAERRLVMTSAQKNWGPFRRMFTIQQHETLTTAAFVEKNAPPTFFRPNSLRQFQTDVNHIICWKPSSVFKKIWRVFNH